MIDDRETCDVCGEEFNHDRPFHEHRKKPKSSLPPSPEEPKHDMLKKEDS